MQKGLLILFVLPLVLNSCSKDSLKEYKTENVIIIVVDGVRYSETWGDTTHQYIPYFLKEVFYYKLLFFYNNEHCFYHNYFVGFSHHP